MTFEEFKSDFNSKLRKRLFYANLVAVFLILFAEVVVAHLFNVSKLLKDVVSYVALRVVIPSGLNFLALLLSGIIIKNKKTSDFLKNLFSVFSIFVLCSVVAIFHNYYSLLLVSMAVPVFMCSIYGDKKILNLIMGMTIPVMIIAFATNWHEKVLDVDVTYKTTNLFCCLIFMILSFVSAYVILMVQRNQMEYMAYSNQNEKNLIQRLQLDPLTELNNRNSLNENVPAIIERVQAEKTNAFLVMIDIDHFKMVNDTFGHLKGDVVLKRLSYVIKENLTNEDRAFRFGGEEFIVIFQREAGFTLNLIKETVEKIKKEFVETKYEFCENPISFSAGICQCSKSISGDEWIKRADEAMYVSKVKGRNQITVCEEV